MERDDSGAQPNSNNPIPHQDASATADPVDTIMQSEKDAINHEARAIPSGLPFPAPGPIGLNPAPSLADTSSPAHHNVPLSEKPHRSSSSDNSSEVAKQPTKSKGFHFGKKRKSQDDEEKKAKEKEDEANKIKPVGVFQLFRYARPFETTFNIIGLFLAMLSGAAQPLMTLIFGRLTTDFTAFGATTRVIAAGGTLTPAEAAALQAAKDSLKTSAGHNALYLMAIGIGMFLTTWAYMFIWNWTGEVNAKRIREKYLHATLRQDVSRGKDTGA
jgi:ATP-binding cassette subfamily B (MDR/TAP) protein 1